MNVKLIEMLKIQHNREQFPLVWFDVFDCLTVITLITDSQGMQVLVTTAV